MSLIEVKKKLLMAQRGGLDVSDVFNISLWTGTGAARTITTGIDSGEGSLVWIKRRDNFNHGLMDTIRGVGNYLSSNTSDGNTFTGSVLTDFGATGYSLGGAGLTNASGVNIVGWQFRRAEKFFDIVQYTGNGVAARAIVHSLGVAPGMIMVKALSSLAGWAVYHKNLTTNHTLYLEETGPSSNNGYITSGTSSSFTVSASGGTRTNANGVTYIAYLFAHDPTPEGFIQCGSYVGNGSSSGPVVDLGWRPQYLMVKNATATGDWQIIDSSRGFTSANDAILLANTSGVETSANLVNPTSTGFQLTSTVSNVNTSGQTYIYMAIREAA